MAMHCPALVGFWDGSAVVGVVCQYMQGVAYFGPYVQHQVEQASRRVKDTSHARGPSLSFTVKRSVNCTCRTPMAFTRNSSNSRSIGQVNITTSKELDAQTMNDMVFMAAG
ncbi:hypothetical protein [Oleidesulfovibrio sp.]|uniref:hypothetical protein n=1 Tax=Oleidesulfovibrio sp. TaxID=2909707 RepID=UPI003A84BD96